MTRTATPAQTRRLALIAKLRLRGARFALLRDGALVGELSGDALTEEAVGALATGAEVAA